MDKCVISLDYTPYVYKTCKKEDLPFGVSGPGTGMLALDACGFLLSAFFRLDPLDRVYETFQSHHYF